MFGLAFQVDEKILYKARKIARCNTGRCGNVRAREFLNCNSEANLRNEKRRRGNITFVRIHAPALWRISLTVALCVMLNLLVLDGCVVAMLTSLIEAAVGLPITRNHRCFKNSITIAMRFSF